MGSETENVTRAELRAMLERARDRVRLTPIACPFVAMLEALAPPATEADWREKCEVANCPVGWCASYGDFDLHPDGRWLTVADTGFMAARFFSESAARAALDNAPPPPGVEKGKVELRNSMDEWDAIPEGERCPVCSPGRSHVGPGAIDNPQASACGGKPWSECHDCNGTGRKPAPAQPEAKGEGFDAEKWAEKMVQVGDDGKGNPTWIAIRPPTEYGKFLSRQVPLKPWMMEDQPVQEAALVRDFITNALRAAYAAGQAARDDAKPLRWEVRKKLNGEIVAAFSLEHLAKTWAAYTALGQPGIYEVIDTQPPAPPEVKP